MDLKKIIRDVLPIKAEYENIAELVAETIDSNMGDFCLPCFSLSKTLHKAPNLIAQDIINELKPSDYISKVEPVAGYVNFFLNRERVGEIVLSEILKDSNEFFVHHDGDGKTLCIDYSSVNLAKYMHIGHLKNTIIGESIARLAESMGYKVVRINYIGDYGTPFGKIIAGYKLWGNKEDVDKRGVDALQELYVKFNQESANDEHLNDIAREYFKKIEEKDSEIYPLYKWIIEISVKEAERLLNILGVKFDSWKGEASYSGQLNQVVELLESKKLTKLSEGATIVDLADYDMPPCLIKRSDGASLYATRDIAAAIDRYKDYHFDKMFYVTGHEQDLHFNQFFKVLELANQSFAKDLEHISYGLFSLPSGKISSRLGKQATLVDLLDYAKNKANQVIEGRTFVIENKDDVADKVARGALNYSALKVEVGKDCVFDVDKAFSFEGETAPYMQYSYTRIISIIRKFEEMNIKDSADYSCLKQPEAFELLKSSNSCKDTIKQAFVKREPSMLAKKAMEICKTLNKYYTTTKILSGNNNEIVGKINLLKLIKLTLEKLFNLICIDTMQEM